MPINWKDRSSYERLLAAVVAAGDMKVDFKRIAHFYGQGATYDSIEGRFRKARKEAAALASEAEGKPIPTSRSSAPSTPRKPATPRTPKNKTPGSTKRKRGKTSDDDDDDDSEIDGNEINDLRATATPVSRSKRAASTKAKYNYDSQVDTDSTTDDKVKSEREWVSDPEDGSFDMEKELKTIGDDDGDVEA